MAATERTRLAFLTLRAQSGDRVALEELALALYPRLRAFAVQLLKDEPAAHDILQDAMVQILRKLHLVHEPRAVETWAFRIVARLAFRWIRARKPAILVEDYPAPPSQAAGSDLVTAEDTRRVFEQIESLSANSRAVVSLHYGRGLSIAETAAALEIPEGTVKSRLASALARLRERLHEGEASC
jgi:RNA polymerase sigma-70 factor (ECF subfamily)